MRHEGRRPDARALDAGAEDFVEEDDSLKSTDPDSFSQVKESLRNRVSPWYRQVTMIPRPVELTDEQAIKNMNRILERSEDDDDVQEVYHNWDEWLNCENK